MVFKEIVKRFWKWTIGLITTIIGGVIAWSFRGGDQPWILKKINELTVSFWTNSTSFLGANLSIPRWWYWILLFVLVFVLFYTCLKIYRWKSSSTYWYYTQDVFDVVSFRWQWSKIGSYSEGEPCKITAHCPNCDLTLESKKKPQTCLEMQQGKRSESYYFCKDCKLEFAFSKIDDAKERIMKKKRECWPEMTRKPLKKP
jgi:hypothetical protein